MGFFLEKNLLFGYSSNADIILYTKFMTENSAEATHRRVINGHVVYYGDDCEDGISYLAHDLDSSASHDYFKAAKHDYTGFEFESQKRREEYTLNYNKNSGSYTLEKR